MHAPSHHFRRLIGNISLYRHVSGARMFVLQKEWMTTEPAKKRRVRHSSARKGAPNEKASSIANVEPKTVKIAKKGKAARISKIKKGMNQPTAKTSKLEKIKASNLSKFPKISDTKSPRFIELVQSREREKKKDQTTNKPIKKKKKTKNVIK
ncbi:hypothetical protein RFI_10425 [Reticulomyxa filosa]|uniref:Uncharacterized protein n=1 Tax=Reticulomyxa filosa TaxID=46433 RepID=X6NK66_RETFI|nr:hypothetical protein RFI_10425 [Reticulomyxa filosa]|eukprot:ETO26710.1 hypothetical protein RFI_10425 [Reticulomyxa filosa]